MSKLSLWCGNLRHCFAAGTLVGHTWLKQKATGQAFNQSESPNTENSMILDVTHKHCTTLLILSLKRKTLHVPAEYAVLDISLALVCIKSLSPPNVLGKMRDFGGIFASRIYLEQDRSRRAGIQQITIITWCHLVSRDQRRAESKPDTSQSPVSVCCFEVGR